MSRHRKAYDEDDLYDDDDYYEDYNEHIGGYQNSEDEENDQEEIDEFSYLSTQETIDFIHENLTQEKSQVPITKQRIKQMLEMYDNNVTKTLNYFVNQKSGKNENKVIAKKEISKQTEAKKVSKKTVINKPETNLIQKKTTTINQIKSDLDNLGLNNNTTNLITGYASDEELLSNSTTSISTEGFGLPHLTLVVSGHVGKSFTRFYDSI